MIILTQESATLIASRKGVEALPKTVLRTGKCGTYVVLEE